MRIRLQGTGHGANLLTELNRCRLSNSLCDVILQVGGRSFPAHRVVLACSASYFRGLFSAGRGAGSVTLDFVTPANFDKVLTFIYTAEIFTDLINVGVLYELAERLGVRELVRACHATFPNLRGSGSSPGEQVADGDPDPGLTPTPTGAVSVCSSSMASSSSASSLSSSGYSTAVPSLTTPLSVPPKGGSRFHVPSPYLSPSPSAPLLSQPPKAEDAGLSSEYDRSADGKHPEQSPLDGGPPRVGDPLLRPPLQLKTEEMEEDGGNVGERERERDTVTGEEPGPVRLSPVEAYSFPDSSAQLVGELCAPSSSSGDPLEGLQMGPAEERLGVEGGDVLFEEDEADEEGGRPVLVGGPGGGNGGTMTMDDIIELSDDEAKYIGEEVEEDEEEEDDEDLVCLEGGARGWAACEACGETLPADAAAVRAHAETHLSETGACRVCGADFAERAAGVTHALSHLGVLLFSCDMCRLQFCSQATLVRHRRQAFAGTAQPQLNSASWGPGGELRCAVCGKPLPKDFQAVRDHLLAHVCVQSLRCGVCQQPQPSLCTLLWHALTHLSLLVYSCPRCACSFLERPLLERHMALHAEDGGGLGPQGDGGAEELRCFLCPQAFHSAAAFQFHLSQHASNLHGRPGKRKSDHALEYSSQLPGEMGGAAKLGHPGAGIEGLLTQGFRPDGIPGVTAGQKAKWYRCRYCGKPFAHSGEFTYHLRIHTGEKPYQCKVCLRFFRGRSTMICHLKTHAGALMYRCTVCGLYFSTLKMVSSHMELHKDCLPPDFNIEQTFMYNDHSKEPIPSLDS